MPSRIDEAGHTKAFDYPVAEHWGKAGSDSNGQHIGPGSNELPTEPPRFPRIARSTGGLVYQENGQ